MKISDDFENLNVYSELVDNLNDIEIFDTVDEVVLSAYNYVKRNDNVTVKAYHNKYKLLMGYETSDGKLFVGRVMRLKRGTNSSLVRELQKETFSL